MSLTSNPVETDFAIIGSGVAGALIAHELSKAGFRVTLIEAGGTIDRPQALQRYRGALIRDLAAPYPRFHAAPIPESRGTDYFGGQSSPDYRPGYLKQVGGTTWHWTGMTPRFLPSDFELHRRYGVGVDWPINYQALEPYYLKAEIALGVAGDSSDDHGSPRSGRYPMPPIPMPYSDQKVAERLAKHKIPVKVFPAARNSQPYHDRPSCCGNNTCTPICPIGAQYSANTDVENAQKLGARLIEQAVVYRFDCDAESNITTAHYKTSDGESHKVVAKWFVVAGNSIESPRLLLMSANSRAPQGIANSSGMVGRNLMDHVIFFKTFKMPVPLYSGRGPQGVSGVMVGRDGEFRKKYAAVKLFLSNDINVQEIASRTVEDQANWSRIAEVIRNKAIHQGCIGGELEPLPAVGNCVTLDEGRIDPLGLPLPKIEYQLSDYLNQGIAKWLPFADDLITKMGAVQTSSFVQHSSHHPCGTLRMGDDATTSVVDRNCRSHDHKNLFVAGSSVFPTMGTANPTLTISALSLRLAEYLILNATR